MRLNKIRIFFTTIMLATTVHVCIASTLELTATYKGSAQKTGGTFTNTTPISGYCTIGDAHCENGEFSILFPWPGNQSWSTSMGSKAIIPSSDKRDQLYFGFDASEHLVNVTNDHGDPNQVSLNINSISWAFSPFQSFDGGMYSNVHGTCTERGVMGTGHTRTADWLPTTPGFNECWINFAANSGFTSGNYLEMGFSYMLKMKDPWAWKPGIYHGTYLYRIGQGKDLDFGNGFTGSADDVTINFTLTVTPDMYVKFWTGQGSVVNADLQPPGGWLNWNGQMPPHLSKEITFDFGSTAPVKMHLICDHAVGKSCGIVDQQGGNALGVDTFLSANHLIDDTGKQALRSPLSTDAHVFTPDTPGGTGVQPARLLFKTQDGVTQNMQRGHQYQGLVTVVFDSDVTP